MVVPTDSSYMSGGMNSSPGAGFLPGGYDSPALDSAKKRASETSHSITPVTILQMHNANKASQQAQEEVIRIDGVAAYHVSFVGIIRTVMEQSTHLVYQIEDGTGSISVNSWIDAEDSELNVRKRSSLREGVYVRVYGQMRNYQGKCSVNGYNLQKIEDYNEITYHMAEVLYIHLLRLKGPSPAPQQQGMPTVTPGRNNFNSNSFTANTAYQQQYQQQAAPQNNGNGFTQAQNAVLDLLRKFEGESAASESGMSVDEMVQRLQGPGMSEMQIREAIASAAEEGHVYSTIDENHYKATGV
eukprot:Nk52_evm21s1671 gene=Nk52_evmTU21s1671